MKREVITVKGKIEQRYEWSTGIALSRFIQELRDNGRIVGTRCRQCNRLMVPPRAFCELCFARTEDWEIASNTGTINCFTVSHIGVDASRLKDPVCIGLIDLDGGGSLFHYFGEVAPADLQIGLRVEAVYKPKAEREGSILDLKYFRPIPA